MANNSAIAFWAAQANDLSSGAHPTGWVSGQRWHVTADQWQALYAAANTSAFDPENQSYSFPGHAPNTVLWSQSAQYWRGQADFFFGPSRVVSSGSSWEALYNAEVAAYNDMVNQRDAGAPPSIDRIAVTGTAFADGVSHTATSATADRSGQWVVIFRAWNNNGAPQTLHIDGFVGGTNVVNNDAITSTPNVGGLVGSYWTGFAATGTAFRLDLRGGGGTTMTGLLDAFFVPTPANPH